MAVLVAAACVLQVAESLLPHPLPGVRLGLANLITLIALVELGPARAIELAVLRTVVSSLLLGTFLSPTFALSFAGGVASAAVMAILFALGRRAGPFRLSVLGISVAGAVSHIATQVLLVYIVFVRSSGVLFLWPWLAIAGVGTGLLTGLIAAQALNRLSATSQQPRANGQQPSAAELRAPALETRWADSWLRRVGPEYKIGFVFLLALGLVFLSVWACYVAVGAVILGLWVLGRAGARTLGPAVRRFAPIGAVSFVLPVLFTGWGRVLVSLGPVRVTDQGLGQGTLFVSRLALLFLATALLSAVTSPDEIARGTSRLLSPLRLVGLRADALGRLLGLSWTYFPVFWDRARQGLRLRAGRRGFIDRLVHLPGDIVADLYRLADAIADGAERPTPDGIEAQTDKKTGQMRRSCKELRRTQHAAGIRSPESGIRSCGAGTPQSSQRMAPAETQNAAKEA
jgi:heptaprenyl diphosphate synthase